uniref:Putative secreted protein n=1 Tax=Anopheles marajoara TaxID=58244 RepID=A0A2M4C706_9DIPT
MRCVCVFFLCVVNNEPLVDCSHRQVTITSITHSFDCFPSPCTPLLRKQTKKPELTRILRFYLFLSNPQAGASASFLGAASLLHRKPSHTHTHLVRRIRSLLRSVVVHKNARAFSVSVFQLGCGSSSS